MNEFRSKLLNFLYLLIGALLSFDSFFFFPVLNQYFAA